MPKSKTKGISPKYASPEAFRFWENGKIFVSLEDKVIDIYAFGIILWELLERQVPWKGKEFEFIRESVLKGNRPEISSRNEFSSDPLITKMVFMIRKAWAHDPIQRSSFNEMFSELQLILKH